MKSIKMLGYLGGSFDPPHCGHLQLAQHAVFALGLDKVYFLPCNQHAFNKSLSAAEHRLKMLELLIDAHKQLAIDRRETERAGISYTLQTLKAIKQQAPGNQASIVFIIGYDVLLTLNQWDHWQELFNYCHLGVFRRSGYRQATLPDWLVQLLKRRAVQQPEQLRLSPHGKIFTFNAHIDDISATKIRQVLQQQQTPAADSIPANIVEYARSMQLYRAINKKSN